MNKYDKAEAEIDALITLIGAHSCNYTGSGHSLNTAKGWVRLVKKYPKVNTEARRAVGAIYHKHKIKSYDNQ
jgi:hypothetical protein